MSDQQNDPVTEQSVPGEQSAPGAGNESLAQSAAAGTGLDALHALRNIPVTVSIELGRTRMSLSELLALGPGSVVELNRMVDEPMDVLVNGTLVARGEVVVIDDNFGVRMTEVADPAEGLTSA